MLLLVLATGFSHSTECFFASNPPRISFCFVFVVLVYICSIIRTGKQLGSTVGLLACQIVLLTLSRAFFRIVSHAAMGIFNGRKKKIALGFVSRSYKKKVNEPVLNSSLYDS